MRFSPPSYLKPKARVLVAMSGGIDSTIAAYLLKNAGYECIGIYMQYWVDPYFLPTANNEAVNRCCSLTDLHSAKTFAHQLGIPFYTLNFREPFKKKVADEFIQLYQTGQTPNPCVTCNRTIKFGLLLQKMRELNADYIATGHYARVILNNKEYELWEGKDKTKDQAYFLHQLKQNQLKYIILPLGDFTKTQVKNLAQKLQLKNLLRKKESQGVCFYPDKNYSDFLKRYLPQTYFQTGEIINLNGKKLGEHQGLLTYTIGQRKGVLMGGQPQPLYVVGFNFAKNQLILGPDEALFTKTIETTQNYWIARAKPTAPIAVDVRIRHLGKKSAGILTLKEGKGLLQLKTPLRAVTPGQFAVYYDGKRVLGGGRIV